MATFIDNIHELDNPKLPDPSKIDNFNKEVDKIIEKNTTPPKPESPPLPPPKETEPPSKTEKKETDTPDTPDSSSQKTGGRKRRKRKTRRKGKKSKKKRTKAGKTPTKKTRTSLNSPIVNLYAKTLRHRSRTHPNFIASSLTKRRRR